VDSNNSPKGVDYVIPGNDDAIRAIELYSTGIADAIIDGRTSAQSVAPGKDEFVEVDKDNASRGKKKVAKKASAKKKTAKKASASKKVTAADESTEKAKPDSAAKSEADSGKDSKA